jgi:hypothetical protein
MFHQLYMGCEWEYETKHLFAGQLDITVKGAVDYGGCDIDNDVPDPTTI